MVRAWRASNSLGHDCYCHIVCLITLMMPRYENFST